MLTYRAIFQNHFCQPFILAQFVVNMTGDSDVQHIINAFDRYFHKMIKEHVLDSLGIVRCWRACLVGFGQSYECHHWCVKTKGDQGHRVVVTPMPSVSKDFHCLLKFLVVGLLDGFHTLGTPKLQHGGDCYVMQGLKASFQVCESAVWLKRLTNGPLFIPTNRGTYIEQQHSPDTHPTGNDFDSLGQRHEK
jgi:hypothetical protein